MAEVKQKTKLKVQNIVATADLGEKVPLVKLVKSSAETEYNPEQFPGLTLRIKKPRAVILVFSSGKLVCTGTKSTIQVKEAIKQVIRILKKINVRVRKVPKINVENIVANGTMKKDLNLTRLSLVLENTEYEPEQFPGLVYKLLDTNATFLLFSNGKFVCTGTKNREQLYFAVSKMLKNIKQAQKL